MATKQEIEITISPDGQVHFQIKGVKGGKCIDETKFLEEALGGLVLEHERTSEFYEESDNVGAGHWVGGKEDSD